MTLTFSLAFLRPLKPRSLKGILVSSFPWIQNTTWNLRNYVASVIHSLQFLSSYFSLFVFLVNGWFGIKMQHFIILQGHHTLTHSQTQTFRWTQDVRIFSLEAHTHKSLCFYTNKHTHTRTCQCCGGKPTFQYHTVFMFCLSFMNIKPLAALNVTDLTTAVCLNGV